MTGGCPWRDQKQGVYWQGACCIIAWPWKLFISAAVKGLATYFQHCASAIVCALSLAIHMPQLILFTLLPASHLQGSLGNIKLQLKCNTNTNPFPQFYSQQNNPRPKTFLRRVVLDGVGYRVVALVCQSHLGVPDSALHHPDFTNLLPLQNSTNH